MTKLTIISLRYFISVCLLCVLAGCSCLTKTQISGINSYSCLLESFVEYPSCILKEFIELKFQVELLNTGTFTDTAVNSKLWNSYNGKQKALKKAEKMDIGIKVLREYASALENLSSKELSEHVAKGPKKLGSGMDTLLAIYNTKNDKKVPKGMGKLVTSSISFLGSSYVKHRQANDLKMYITEGDSLISVITEALKTELSTLVLNEWLVVLKEDLKNRQINFLQNIPRSEYKVYLANSYNREVATLIARIDTLEQLTKKTIASMDKIKKAHKQLLTHIQERKKMDSILSEIQELYVSVKEMYDSYHGLISN